MFTTFVLIVGAFVPYITFVGEVIHSPTNSTVIERQWAELSAQSTVACWATIAHCGTVRIPCGLTHALQVTFDTDPMHMYWIPSSDTAPWVPCEFNAGEWSDRLLVIAYYGMLYVTLLLFVGMAVTTVRWPYAMF